MFNNNQNKCYQLNVFEYLWKFYDDLWQALEEFGLLKIVLLEQRVHVHQCHTPHILEERDL